MVVVDLVVIMVVVEVVVVVVVVVVVTVVIIGSRVGENVFEVDSPSVEDFMEVFISSTGSSVFSSSWKEKFYINNIHIIPLHSNVLGPTCCCNCFLNFVLEMRPRSLLRFKVPVGRNLRGPVPPVNCSFMNFSNSAFNGEFSPRAAIISSSSLSSSSSCC